jgi:MSHA biogenesis protein MshN
MSLVNKMLKDLEARQAEVRKPAPQSIYQGLRVASHTSRRRRLPWALLLAGGLVVSSAGVGGWWAWSRYRPAPPPIAVAPPATSAPVASAVAPVEAKPVVAPARKPRPVARTRNLPPVAAKGKGSMAIAVTGHPLTPAEQAENMYRDAVQRVRQLRTADAEQQLRSALALDPKHVHARETLAALLVEQGRWLEAEALLEEGLGLRPDQVSFGFLLARLYVEQGRDTAGLQMLERLRPHAGGDADFTAFLATLEQRTGRHADAIGHYQQATSARPAEGRWWAGLGISLEAENQRDAARAAYERASALALDPRLAEYVAERLKQLPGR